MNRRERRHQEKQLRKAGMESHKLTKIEELAAKGIQSGERELMTRQQMLQTDLEGLKEAVAERLEIPIDDIGTKWRFDFSTYRLVSVEKLRNKPETLSQNGKVEDDVAQNILASSE